MPSASQPSFGRVFVPVFVLGALLATAVPVSAQGFGLGARFDEDDASSAPDTERTEQPEPLHADSSSIMSGIYV